MQFQRLRAEYQKLISVTAELTSGLEEVARARLDKEGGEVMMMVMMAMMTMLLLIIRLERREREGILPHSDLTIQLHTLHLHCCSPPG